MDKYIIYSKHHNVNSVWNNYFCQVEYTNNLRILFTGGGTAGHVTPNIALMQTLTDHELHYVGTDGMEKQLIDSCGLKVCYHQIEATKLRRKLTIKNLTTPFAFAKSVAQCKQILQRVSPNVVFSKGGYVGLPVVVACKLLHIPCLIHESDVSMGLANKLGAELYNLAISGDRFFPELLEYDMGVTPDIITVAYGTNDWYVHSRPTVERRSEEFIKRLSEKYPSAKIFMVSPIDRLSHEKAPRFGDYLPVVYDIIKKNSEGLDNVTVIDGWNLVPADPVYFADGLHPNDFGFEFYAENLYNEIKKYL